MVLKVYERWQFASLADVDLSRAAQSPSRNEVGPTPAEVSAHELAVIRETARADGHTAGFGAGRAEGLEAANAEIDHLRRLAAAMAAAFSDLQDETAEALLTLALDAARQVLRCELQGNPEAILAGIREAVDLAGGGIHPQILLNPGDLGFVQRHLGDELVPGGWRLTEDARIEPGGCRVVTANGAIDATLKTRWQRVVGSLGRSDPLEAPETVAPLAGEQP